jgi:hypothetical protein
VRVPHVDGDVDLVSVGLPCVVHVTAEQPFVADWPPFLVAVGSAGLRLSAAGEVTQRHVAGSTGSVDGELPGGEDLCEAHSVIPVDPAFGSIGAFPAAVVVAGDEDLLAGELTEERQAFVDAAERAVTEEVHKVVGSDACAAADGAGLHSATCVGCDGCGRFAFGRNA